MCSPPDINIGHNLPLGPLCGECDVNTLLSITGSFERPIINSNISWKDVRLALFEAKLSVDSTVFIPTLLVLKYFIVFAWKTLSTDSVVILRKHMCTHSCTHMCMCVCTYTLYTQKCACM